MQRTKVTLGGLRPLDTPHSFIMNLAWHSKVPLTHYSQKRKFNQVYLPISRYRLAYLRCVNWTFVMDFFLLQRCRNGNWYNLRLIGVGKTYRLVICFKALFKALIFKIRGIEAEKPVPQPLTGK